VSYEALNRMLNPRSVAVVGASEKPGYGGRLMKNLIQHRYEGLIYPINPTSDQIFGHRCYTSLLEVPGEIDLVVIVVKAELIASILSQCELKNVGSVLIISAGFNEQGTDEGKARERMLIEWSARTQIPICGPNCLGIGSSGVNMWASSASSLGESQLPSGSIGLISHSGATAFGPLLNRSKDYGVGYRYIVSTGNESAVSMAAFADYMLNDPKITAIGLFIEGIQDGEAFIHLADKALLARKPIIALKIGESEVGRKAAASHTASLTGNQQVFEALCRQKGIVLAKDYDEFITTAKCLEGDGRALTGTKLAVLSHSGGIGGFVGDKLGAMGLEVPSLESATRAQIDALLTGFGSSGNPLDLSGTMQTEQLVRIYEILAAEETFDGFVFATHGKLPLIERLGAIHANCDKPVYLLWTGSQEDPLLSEVRSRQIPLFFLPEKLAATLRNIYFAGKAGRRLQASASVPRREQAGLATAERTDKWSWPDLTLYEEQVTATLTEVEGKRLLQHIGIRTPISFYLENGGDFEAFARGIDFRDQKFVAKIVSRKITHKSDNGGVALNLASSDDVLRFYETQVAGASADSGIDGMLLEEMIHNKVELILGSATDPQFGPVVMVGLGGVYTELFKLVNWRVAPVRREEAREMLEEIKGLVSYMQGYRNMPRMDLDALIATIVTFSHWVYEQRAHISDIEINPLAVLPDGHGVCALDCVIGLRKGGAL